ncbi:MAG: glycosyl transferase family 1 [Rhodospirillaceae bacterium]|jgi:putative ABC transport system permease protein|nr:glycosyl transferase family 1 [Rhodospirillales bacterium]MAX48398.1 glycosyl transferase family 1 [Rhodospirillaceae bacterium]|tara:strand:- start:31959 stop:34478 length:2520 start_codon:yes stop_codon:yes gene_type:complete
MVSARIARRELRGGLKGFRVFVACLALGVAAIAGVGSLASAIEAGLKADGRVLLGGDIDLRLTHVAAAPNKLEWLRANSEQVSQVVEMRAMAIRADGTDRHLIELKTVDEAYPLYGKLVLEDGVSLNELDKRDGAWGLIAAPQLVERMGLSKGDRLKIGEATFDLRGTFLSEPDKGTQAFDLGPRVFIPRAALAETQLEQPGSLIRYHYRIALAPGTDVAAWTEQLNTTFPGAGWRVRALDDAAPNIQRFVDRVGLFLTLVGLTALLVGGVGVGNAVRAFLNQRTATIATLKCLGASSSTIFSIYMLQVGALAIVGIIAGLIIGGAGPALIIPLLADRLPVEARMGLYPFPLILAAAFGLLTTLVFALWPLAKASNLPAATLFRDLLNPVMGRPGPRMAIALSLCAIALVGLAVLTADQPLVALAFCGGAVGTLLAFRAAASGAMTLARRLPRARNIRIALAVANLHRPGAPTASVVVSLGLGLTVLIAVAMIEGNLSKQVSETFRGEAPGFYFIDIQPDQIDDFRTDLDNFNGLDRYDTVPMLRGRITALAGVPVEQIEPPSEVAWILRGDRGITWSRTPPIQGSEIVEGDWWPEDYSDASRTLVSFDAEAAELLNLKIGDKITVNVLGREIEAEISNLRDIDWTTLGINFVMIFSPGVIESAPQMYIATAYLPADREVALEQELTDQFPNVSAIRVKEVLEGVDKILKDLGTAVTAIAGIAILAGILVLAGAVAAGHNRRIYESVVLKVLGATRRDILIAYLLEFGLLGLMTAVIAGVVGGIAAYVVIEFVMQAEWIFVPEAAALTVVVALIATVSMGFVGTWSALGKKAAPLMRNE